MSISDIWFSDEKDDAVSVKFSNISSVNTIFKYVRNLSHGQKVSINVPPVLSDRYKHLESQAYHIRNGEVRQSTVIKYSGNDLVLLAKMPDSKIWKTVPDKPPADQSSPSKLPMSHGLIRNTPK